MTVVKVKFTLEATDPDHELGLSDRDYQVIHDAIDRLGGYDVEFEKDDEA